jgi:hypothetical protein
MFSVKDTISGETYEAGIQFFTSRQGSRIKIMNVKMDKS